MTKTHKERIEEKQVAICSPDVKKKFGFECGLFVHVNDVITIRREWLEEGVNKMEGMLKPISKAALHEWEENDPITLPWEVRERKTYNTSLQTLIDEDRKELEELTN